jgi:cytochrome P450
MNNAAPLPLPPGPTGIGAAVFVGRFLSAPLESLKTLHSRYGDISHLLAANERYVLITRPELIDEVLSNRASIMIKDRTLRELKTMFGEGLLTSEGDFWRGQRRQLAPAFTPKRVSEYGDIMSGRTQEMVDGWTDGERVDIHDEIMALTLRIVVQTLFDSDVSGDEMQVGHLVEETMLHVDRELNSFRAFIPRKVPTPSRRRFATTILEFDRIVLDIIERQRQNQGQNHGGEGRDLLSQMLAMRDESGKGMSDRQIRDEVLTLFLAGHETTALALTWTFMLLSQHPNAERRLRDEVRSLASDRPLGRPDMAALPFTTAVIRESMRLHPPAWIIGREPTEDIELGGYRVPAGTQLLIPMFMMHRDPEYFVRPNSFEPDRWLDGLAERLPRTVYMPFGGGPRVCIGNHFAMMEAVLLLATIVRDWSFRVQPGYEPELVPSITLRPRHGMPGIVQRIAKD